MSQSPSISELWYSHSARHVIRTGCQQVAFKRTPSGKERRFGHPMHTRSIAAFSPDSLYPLDGKLVSSELVDLTDLGLRRSGLGLP